MAFCTAEAYTATLFHQIQHLEEKVQKLRIKVKHQRKRISQLDEYIEFLEDNPAASPSLEATPPPQLNVLQLPTP